MILVCVMMILVLMVMVFVIAPFANDFTAPRLVGREGQSGELI